MRYTPALDGQLHVLPPIEYLGEKPQLRKLGHMGILNFCITRTKRDVSLSITNIRARRLGFDHRVQIGSGAHPTSYRIGTGGPFLEGKRPRREADHSSPSSAEFKNKWSYISNTLCVFKQAQNTTSWRDTWLCIRTTLLCEWNCKYFTFDRIFLTKIWQSKFKIGVLIPELQPHLEFKCFPTHLKIVQKVLQ
jgi:hypothetical protein